MAAFRLDLIGRYLRPHRRTVLLGAVALVVVNMLSVTIPLEVRRVIDDLQDGFAITDVLRQAGWIVVLASSMGVVRLISRQLVFGVGRQVEVELRQRLFDHMLRQDPGWVQETGWVQERQAGCSDRFCVHEAEPLPRMAARPCLWQVGAGSC